MATEVNIPFPLKGYDSNWAYANQPGLTTPKCLNVRAYSVDEQRARGGSRPGLKRAYTQQVGSGNPIQGMGWFDFGFGETALFEDEFDYANGALNGNAAWSGASADLTVTSGQVKPSTTPATDLSSGEYQSFAGAEWDNFDLDFGLNWNYATTGSITLWVSSSSGNPTDGMTLTVAYTSESLPSPMIGFNGTLEITLVVNGGVTTTTKKFVQGLGPLVALQGGGFKVIADSTTVRVYWLDRLSIGYTARNSEIISVARPTASAHCSKAGFKLSQSNTTGESTYDDLISFRLLDWHLLTKEAASATTRKLVVLSNRQVWSDSSNALGATADDADQMADVPLYSMAHCNGSMFVVDGTTPRVYNPLRTDKLYSWTARKGTIDTACSIVVNWRNRLVLARTLDDPQNYFMSRIDDPWDFAYGMDDSGTAIAGNTGSLGRIGNPITALCPLSDSTLIIGTTRGVYAMHGDPAAGGGLRTLSDKTGILCQSAWTMDDKGVMYFLGEGGLYAIAGGGVIPLTDQRIPGLGNVTPVHPGAAGATGQTYVCLAYDLNRKGILIMLSPYTSGTATHYFYDVRNKAFWPESYPNVVGPTCGVFYNATTEAYRQLLIGGRNGYVYQFDDATKSDVVDGSTTTAISSYVYIGPARFGGGIGEAVTSRIVGVLGADSDEVTYGIHSGATPEASIDATAQVTGTWSAGRNVTRDRVRGGALVFSASNSTAGKAWSLESIHAEILPGGVQR
ncbi:MAG: hypothetical protein GXY83_15695 [Rhodopirellula sp.]|nr:hypothetical protein [Rhodopirellula sp.]